MIICIVLQQKCINNTNTVDVLHKCNSSLETEDKNAQDNQTNPKRKRMRDMREKVLKVHNRLHSKLFLELLCLLQPTLLRIVDCTPQIEHERLLGKLAQVRVLQSCGEVTWVCFLCTRLPDTLSYSVKCKCRPHMQLHITQLNLDLQSLE